MTEFKGVIQRTIKSKIEETLIPNKVNLIFGSRRVGKTFLVRQLAQQWPGKVLILNGEDSETAQLVGSRSIAQYRRLLDGIDLLVIDEAQALPEIGRILKLIVDELTGIRIIATGSSAFDLRNQTGEPLTGRAYNYQLYPISQMELQPLENALDILRNRDERMIYGGYPELWQLPSVQSKESYLRDLVNAYLLKDILSFEGIRHASKVVGLLKLIAYQVGKEVSMEELGRQLQISKNTVEKYLDLLTKVFILIRVSGYSRNLRKEITKNSRWYFVDNGIRNALLNNFQPLSIRNDVGDLWENYLFSERLKKQSYTNKAIESYFWRTYDQQEIDLIETDSQTMRAFKFKWKPKPVKAPKAFMEAYPDAFFQVISTENYLDFIT